MKAKLFHIVLILALLALWIVPVVSAAPKAVDGRTDDPDFVRKPDNLPDPLTTQQLALKAKALEAKLNGKANGPTHEVARGQYVELEREGEGRSEEHTS